MLSESRDLDIEDRRTQKLIRIATDIEFSLWNIINLCRQNNSMSKEPKKRYKDTKESAESSIEERPEPPIDKPDPTEHVKVGGAKEEKGADVGL